MAKKTVEQKLFEAASKMSGVRLDWKDVWALVMKDEAIGTRITDRAASEAGIPEPGASSIPDKIMGVTWQQFKDHIKAHS